jgi:hypothetical protein
MEAENQFDQIVLIFLEQISYPEDRRMTFLRFLKKLLKTQITINLTKTLEDHHEKKIIEMGEDQEAIIQFLRQIKGEEEILHAIQESTYYVFDGLITSAKRNATVFEQEKLTRLAQELTEKIKKIPLKPETFVEK